MVLNSFIYNKTLFQICYACLDKGFNTVIRSVEAIVLYLNRFKY